MNEKIKNVIKFLFFLTISVLLFWYVFKDQDIEELKASIKNANLNWILLSLVLGLLSHISRAVRWNILIEPLGYKPTLKNTFSAVMIMYMSNYIIPRMGEVARVSVLKKYEKIPFTELLGTVFTERVVDMILLLVFTLYVFFTQTGTLITFAEQNPNVYENYHYFLNLKEFAILLFITGIIFLVALYLLRKHIKKLSVYKKIRDLIKKFLTGILTIKNMERKWEFLAHSIFIYIMYFTMIYVCFFSFEETSHLDLTTGITVFVMAGFGMVAPVQGGIGAWHWLVTRTLVVFGISLEPVGNAFAILVHGSSSLMLIIVGFIALILLPLHNKNQNTENEIPIE